MGKLLKKIINKGNPASGARATGSGNSTNTGKLSLAKAVQGPPGISETEKMLRKKRKAKKFKNPMEAGQLLRGAKKFRKGR